MTRRPDLVADHSKTQDGVMPKEGGGVGGRRTPRVFKTLQEFLNAVQQVDFMRKLGAGISAIADSVGFGRVRVRGILNYEEYHLTWNGPGGRPHTLNHDQELWIAQQFLTNARLSDGDVAKLVGEYFGHQISRERIGRIRREFHIHYRPAICVQKLTKDHKAPRAQWAIFLFLFLLSAFGVDPLTIDPLR